MGLTIPGSILERGKILFSFSHRLDGIWGPPVSIQGFLLAGIKRREFYTGHFHSVPTF